MLLPSSTSPSQSIYFLSTYVLKVLLRYRQLTYDDLYQKTNKPSHPINSHQFVLCLDWLFLVGAIQYQNDLIILCS